MTTIELNRSWKKGKQIGDPGGFGQVFEAEADDGSAAAIKLVPKEPGASRELLFEELSGLPNIIPILDSGEWEDYYVLVMPRAEESLRKHLNDSGGQLGLDEAAVVLCDVAAALSSLDGEVIHRDIKPENILLYEGHWCISDFGISRYAEAATSADTRKFMMTAPYAAPEQWRGERATNATDIYGFGVMSYEMMQGHLPFGGPGFREQHLNDSPPAMKDCPAPMASLINECLFKNASARPAAGNVLARLQATNDEVSPAQEKLRGIQRDVVQKQGVEAARSSAAQELKRNRQELFADGRASLKRIQKIIEERVTSVAAATEVSPSGGGLRLDLNGGMLVIGGVDPAPPECLAAFDYKAPFDVVAYTAMFVKKPRDRYDYEGRSHSLWYCDAQSEGVYRWYELSFMIFPGIPERHRIDPFALPPMDEYAGAALTPVGDVRQVAWQPLAFDQGDEDQFVERWLGWFAEAAAGSLSRPRSMPENSGGSYRFSQERKGS